MNTHVKVPVSIANARVDVEEIVYERSRSGLALSVYLGWYTTETNAGTSCQEVAISEGKVGSGEEYEGCQRELHGGEMYLVGYRS